TVKSGVEATKKIGQDTVQAATDTVKSGVEATKKIGQDTVQAATDTVKSGVEATKTKLSGKTDNEAEKTTPATEEEKT
ncbi:MAG: hypothetical protein ABFS56_17330, partial [Pseudomonadota bacterium]